MRIELSLLGDYVFKNITIQADMNGLNQLAEANRKYKTLIGAFTYSGQWGTLGIAWIGTACNTNGMGAGITELFTEVNSELMSARTYVHELGHNLGMQ